MSRAKPGIPSNHLTTEQAREMSAAESLTWSELEKKVDGLLRQNSWVWWRDRVVPQHLLAGLPAKKQKQLQSVGRKAGLPDRIARRRFERLSDVPTECRKLLGIPPELGYGPLVVMCFCEIKQGRATTSASQDEWLEAASLTPGCFSFVARPTNLDTLATILGGER